MTTISIHLPEEQVAALEAKATAQGLTLEGWFQKMADREAPVRPRYTLEELVGQCDPDAPLTEEDRRWLDARPAGREEF
jgi:hypothetical protein